MFNHQTAMSRKRLSAPMLWLKKQGLLAYGSNHLDYGCGKGFDADFLNCEKFDPYYSPKMPEGKFRVITCIYVLNVIASVDERDRVIRDIKSRLTEKGRGYIVVRRDFEKNGKAARQYEVELNEPSVRHYKGQYEVYVVKKD